MKPAKAVFEFKMNQKVSYQSVEHPQVCGVGYVTSRAVNVAGGKEYRIRSDYENRSSLVSGGSKLPAVITFKETELRRISDEHPDIRQTELDL